MGVGRIEKGKINFSYKSKLCFRYQKLHFLRSIALWNKIITFFGVSRASPVPNEAKNCKMYGKGQQDSILYENPFGILNVGDYFALKWNLNDRLT